jgi:hypothetical protein
MGALFKYLVVCGALVGLAWLSFGVEMGGRTLYGHARSLRSADDLDNVVARLKRDLAGRMVRWEAEREAMKAELERDAPAPKKTSPARPTAPAALPPPTPKEAKAQVQRVERLKLAAEALRATAPKSEPAPRPKSAPPPKKTYVDGQLSADEEKALDDLLTARVQRLQ